MYIYKIEGYLYDEEYACEYIIHDINYSKEEFSNICKNALLEIKHKYAMHLRDYLVKNCGFKPLPVYKSFIFIEGNGTCLEQHYAMND